MKQSLQNLRWSSVAKRILLLIIPAVMIPLGVSGYFAAGLGSDPFSVFIDGLRNATGLTPGMVVIIFSAIVIPLMFFFGRKYLKVGTVLIALTIGPLIDVFFTAVTAAMHFSGEPGLILRVAVMLCAAVMLSVGVGLFVAVDFGIGTLEWIVILIANRFNTSVGRAKIILDSVLVASGFIMGGIVGFGTVIGIVFTGLLIDVTLKLLRNPIKNYVGSLRNGEENKAGEAEEGK